MWGGTLELADWIGISHSSWCLTFNRRLHCVSSIYLRLDDAVQHLQIELSAPPTRSIGPPEAKMSYITRTLGNIRKIGLKEYWHQLQYIGDTKAGTLMGVDKAGNKFYENNDELPLRTRWVDYKKHDFDPAQIEPLWHLWISHGTDTVPTQDPSASITRSWASTKPLPNYTATPGAFKTYNTTKPKISAWEPVAAPRN